MDSPSWPIFTCFEYKLASCNHSHHHYLEKRKPQPSPYPLCKQCHLIISYMLIQTNYHYFPILVINNKTTFLKKNFTLPQFTLFEPITDSQYKSGEREYNLLKYKKQEKEINATLTIENSSIDKVRILHLII